MTKTTIYRISAMGIQELEIYKDTTKQIRAKGDKGEVYFINKIQICDEYSTLCPLTALDTSEYTYERRDAVALADKMLDLIRMEFNDKINTIKATL